MSLSVYKLQKWAKMLLGRSELHVHQGIGKCMDNKSIRGYYNDFTGKLSYVSTDTPVPLVNAGDDGIKREFSIAIFQYGLAYYDLYLLDNDRNMLTKMQQCAEWAIRSQLPDGSWETFAFQDADNPYSAMAQGEGISLLCRAYIETADEKYLDCIKKAYSFMLKPLDKGGVTLYEDNDDGVFLYEYTNMSPVLNGWIFAMWGIWDYCLLFADDKDARELLDKSINTLALSLKYFEKGHWTYYNMDRSIIASSHYHYIHLSQMKSMYMLTNNDIFRYYAERWERWLKNPVHKTFAFIIKVAQKLFE